MQHKPLTDEQIIEMKEMWDQGKTTKYIADYFNVSSHTVSEWHRKNFKRLPYVRRCTSPRNKIILDMKKVEELYSKGYTYKDIAKEMNCSSVTVLKRVKEERQKDPSFLSKEIEHVRKTFIYNQIKDLLEQNYTVKEIAEKLDISEYSFRYYKDIVSLQLDKVSVNKLIQQNNSLIEENKTLHETVESLKRELEVAYQIDDYNSSDIPALRRRIYDLEETFDAIKQHFNIGLAQMSSVRYTEYQIEKENL